jgi:hypothetical protein
VRAPNKRLYGNRMSNEAKPATVPNPMAALLRKLSSTPQLREELWADPRALITRLATPFPEDIAVRTFRDASGVAYFEAGLPKRPTRAPMPMRMSRCPVAKISGAELAADPAAALAPYGIRVPEDIAIGEDDDYLYLRVPLEE